jgi:integrase
MNRNSALALLEQHPAAGAAQMRIRPLGGNTTARRPRDKSLLQEIGFVDVLYMIKRRAKGAGLPYSTCCHSFRATGMTAYLQNGGTLEHTQQIAAHQSPRTTKLYDRTKDEISLDEVERIKF